MDVENQPLNESVPIDYQFIRVLIGIVIVVLTLIVYTLIRRGKSVRNHLLLMGPSDSGKTLLFARLAHGVYVETHTSMKENISNFATEKAEFKLVDIPGYERLRDKYFDKYKGVAHSILYVVDSDSFQTDVRDVAEYLYNILSDSEILGKINTLIVVCHKQDLPLAKTSSSIKSMLQKELDTLRKTKSSQLEFVDSSSKQSISLGKADKQFEFEDLNCKVAFVESSNIQDAEKGLQELEDEINNL